MGSLPGTTDVVDEGRVAGGAEGGPRGIGAAVDGEVDVGGVILAPSGEGRQHGGDLVERYRRWRERRWGGLGEEGE